MDCVAQRPPPGGRRDHGQALCAAHRTVLHVGSRNIDQGQTWVNEQQTCGVSHLCASSGVLSSRRFVEVIIVMRDEPLTVLMPGQQHVHQMP
jgi:hypothetical protein